MSTVLVVAAHPDDEVLGCGGAIVRHVEHGDEIHVLFVADGVRGRYDQWPDDIDARIETRQEEARRVARWLGIAGVEFLPYLDQAVTASPALIRHIEAAVEAAQPQVVYTHRLVDENRDHREVVEAVCIAVRSWTRLDRLHSVDEVRGFGIPPVFAQRDLLFRVALSPRHVELKLGALALYESETADLPSTHPRHTGMLRAQMAAWGSWIGAPYAETFEILWRNHSL